MIYTKQWSGSHPDRVCWRAKVGYNITALYSCSYATTVLYSETRKAVFQHGQGKNHWHLPGIYNTNLYLWNTGEVQKNPEKVKFMYLSSIIHILLLLCFCSSWVFIYTQAKLDWVCVHSNIRMKVQLYWESSKNYSAVVSAEKKKKASLVTCAQAVDRTKMKWTKEIQDTFSF